jgi:predicted RNA binding protein YcfA (HicA-like mRNA interferase family)
MSRQEKILERLKDFQRDNGWNFDDLCGVLTGMGFEMRIAGSHHFFRRADLPDALNLQPQGGRAKSYQVRQVRKVLEANGLL